MHDFFNIRTLSLFSGFISACLFISMIYIYKMRKTYPGFKQWALAYMLNFFGFIFLSLRNILPDFYTIIVANTFIVICFVLIARGLNNFAENEQNNWIDILLPSVLVLSFCYFVYVSPNVNARIVIISLIVMFISFRCAFITHRRIAVQFDQKNWLLTTAFVFVAVWLLLRTCLTASIEGNIHDFMSTGAIQGTSIIVGIIGHIFIVIGLIMITGQRLEKNLITANEEIKTLRGFLPICSYCKKIRDDKGYWTQIESYIQKNSEAVFSHSICQDCAKKHYPNLNI